MLYIRAALQGGWWQRATNVDSNISPATNLWTPTTIYNLMPSPSFPVHPHRDNDDPMLKASIGQRLACQCQRLMQIIWYLSGNSA
jgi:hypothetical protein